MINISRLYFGLKTPGDALRYGDALAIEKDVLGAPPEGGPIVVWTTTLRCNLKCIHCYSDSQNRTYPGELTTSQAEGLITDLARFGVPAVLFSGGEPLMRKDIFRLGEKAVSLGVRAVLSTNGTLINLRVARHIQKAGFSYVGVSLDGMEKINDAFRGSAGAFKLALRGIRNCQEVGIPVGLRFTLTKHNFKELPKIFDLIDREEIGRACFYHLVYQGRGISRQDDDLSHPETRKVVDYIISRTEEFYKKGKNKDILTVDNHADGVYLYLKLKKENPSRAAEALRLLKINGGNSSGIRLGGVDSFGNVYPDQFWQAYKLGNVLKRPFSSIWIDTNEPMLKALRNRKPLLKGRCRGCRWLDICNGGFRARAEAFYGDPWAEDPACYLTEDEIRRDKKNLPHPYGGRVPIQSTEKGG